MAVAPPAPAGPPLGITKLGTRAAEAADVKPPPRPLMKPPGLVRPPSRPVLGGGCSPAPAGPASGAGGAPFGSRLPALAASAGDAALVADSFSGL